jgi:S-DNA-T family DNA segregation ATPase FtsK/SpoIIIE
LLGNRSSLKLTILTGGELGEVPIYSFDFIWELQLETGGKDEMKREFEAKAKALLTVLRDYDIGGKMVGIKAGPVVTLFEFEPAPGTKSAKVINLAADVARSMSAVSCRISVIPGRNAIGMELPNAKRKPVLLEELVKTADFTGSTAKLPVVLGKNIMGEPVIVDIAKMPHLLVAGTTGSGKSVGINTMIVSLLKRMTPEQCRFIMIDPKMLEFSVYNGIPHLLMPVVTDPVKSLRALQWAAGEMTERYDTMSEASVKNIGSFNEQAAADERLPYIVIVIDEVADLMMVAGKEVELVVQRLAQMARAAGIHVIMATQRPSVDVITGTIKANFPTRISFQVTSKIDSRTILGEQGAEQLLGAGDMLYMAGAGRIQRVHGAFISDSDVEALVAGVKGSNVAPIYLDVLDDDKPVEVSGPIEELDQYEQAKHYVLLNGLASPAAIQRHFGIGYFHAEEWLTRMEDDGLVTPVNSGKRAVIYPF